MTAPTISASLVKELREQTGAGMMDCKRALEETGGDVEAARTLLRERGMASAAKRAGREVTEGLVGYRIADGRGTMVGVGCETEPVSKNDEFQAFATKVLDSAHEQGVEALERLEDERIDLVAKLGENIVIAGKARFQADEGEIVDGYVHPPANKLGVLVLLRGGDDDAYRGRDSRAARVDQPRGSSRRRRDDGTRDLRELRRGPDEAGAGA